MTPHDIRNCDGGHICNPPKDCCKQGCCWVNSTIIVTNMDSPIFVGHWYFWVAIIPTLAGILCACSLWKRHNSSSLCCRDSGRDERASEPDSNGSCYAPPQYSRCSSFHQPPPPYSEVVSKPDVYPLVISYNGDPLVKTNGTSTGYLMVQYFRNFIVRPVGTLSATSTIDSLSSSFICNATNEANTIIPPPYSCMGSLEEVNSTNNGCSEPPATTSPSLNELPRNSPSVYSNMCSSSSTSLQPNNSVKITMSPGVVEVRTSPTEVIVVAKESTTKQVPPVHHKILGDLPNPFPFNIVNKKLNFSTFKNHSVDSESDENNFSDLLNLSVCVPSSVTHLASTTQSNPQMDMIQSYSVTNSMTSSDISSLANLGTPDSPPRATSPTLEMRELLDKIQQLPQHTSPVPETVTAPPKVKNYFRAKAKTMYMPLHSNPPPVKPNFGKPNRGWLSRSAPTTPCGTFVPNFPSQKKNSGSQRGSKTKISDGSPLLHEHDESEDEPPEQLKPHKKECL